MKAGARSHWTDGCTAIVTEVVAAFLIPVMKFRHQADFEPILAMIIMVVAMGFFWSGLWKSGGRDIWAWISLPIGAAVGFGIFHISVAVNTRT